MMAETLPKIGQKKGKNVGMKEVNQGYERPGGPQGPNRKVTKGAGVWASRKIKKKRKKKKRKICEGGQFTGKIHVTI